MTVQNSEAPCGKYEQACAGKEDAHQTYGQQALLAGKSRRDRIDQVGRRQNSNQHENRSTEREQRRDSTGRAASFLLLIARKQSRVHGNEGSGENSLAEKIRECVGNSERRLKCVRGIGISEIVREYPVADQPRDPAEKNSRGDKE